MSYLHSLFALLLGICTLQGALAAKYCFCEGSPGFRYLGIEQVCEEVGTQWNPINCDLGSSDVCKYKGAEAVDGDTTQTLKTWCQSKERKGIDPSGKELQGGELTCTDTKPDGVEDSCEPLEDNGLEQVEEGPPLDSDVPTNATGRAQSPPRLIRRDTDDGTRFLRYSPENPTQNLVMTREEHEIMDYDHDGSQEIFYQINELRLKGYEWRLLKSYDNRKGSSDYTESVDVLKGLETASGSNTKAELNVEFGYDSLVTHFKIDAKLAHEFFSNTKQSQTEKTATTFLVRKHKAVYLYQKVYKWESKVYFRLESTGPKFEFRGKNGERGSFTLGTNDNKPFEQALRFDIAKDQRLVQSKGLKRKGTFDVEDEFELMEPLYPKESVLKEDRWSGFVHDQMRKRGYKH